MFNELVVMGGTDKNKHPETLPRLHFNKGNIYSIVGHTGSGKTQLIEDIESLCQGDSITGRKILLDGNIPDDSIRYASTNPLISHLSQNMHFVLDMSVHDFLLLRCRCKGITNAAEHCDYVLGTANTLSGEWIKPNHPLPKLSGGQSRALMIADVAINGDTPIILIDELENAGINRLEAMNLLTKAGKIVLIVTHDPLLALLGTERIIMKNGGIHKRVARTHEETRVLNKLRKHDDLISEIRTAIRDGQSVEEEVVYGL